MVPIMASALQVCYAALLVALPLRTWSTYNKLCLQQLDTSAIDCGFASRRWLLENVLSFFYLLALVAAIILAWLGQSVAALAWAPAWLQWCLVLAWSYAILFARTAGQYAEDPSDFPRTRVRELRTPRYTWYKTRLADRMQPLRLWWLLLGIAHCAAFASRTVDELSALLARASAAATGSTAAADTGAASAEDNGNIVTSGLALSISVWLNLAPFILGWMAAYTLCAWRAKDFVGRTRHAESWTWPAQQVGELPHQQNPYRLLSPRGLLEIHTNTAPAAAQSHPLHSALRHEGSPARQPGGLGTAAVDASVPPRYVLSDGGKPRPMRIVILTIGTRGDVQPYISLALHLRAAGHSVGISTTRDFKDFIARFGLEYLDTGIARIEQPESWMKVTSVAEMIAVTATTLTRDYQVVASSFARACSQPNRADVIIGTAMTVTFALNIGEAHGIPVWVAKLAPDIPSRAAVLPGYSLSRYGWLNMLRCYSYWLAVASATQRAGIEAAENEFRRALGLPPLDPFKRVAEMTYTPQLLGYSRHLFPKPVDYPDWAFEVGFWLLNEATHDAGEDPAIPSRVPPAVRDFMQRRPDSRQPDVAVVSFGSMIHTSRPMLLEDIVDVILSRGLRVLVLTGWRGKPQHVKPDARVLWAPEAPHDYVFDRASFVVHHGGAGTTARALACGIPSVIFPVLRWSDQMQWGSMVHRMKLGVFVGEDAPSVATIEAAIDMVRAGSLHKAPFTGSVIGDTANAVGASVRAEPAGETALTLLESCLCNLVLTPAEADAIHPSRGAVPPLHKLSPTQAMCVRNCVPCSRHRGEVTFAPPLRRETASLSGSLHAAAAALITSAASHVARSDTAEGTASSEMLSSTAKAKSSAKKRAHSRTAAS